MSFFATKDQAGVVLLLCLLFLTALTLLALSASADAVLQNQLAANLRETERAKQSALAALSWTEDWLLDLQGAEPVYCPSPCTGLNILTADELLSSPEFADLTWWQTRGYEAGIDPLTGERLATFATHSIDPPMWIVALVHKTPVVDDGSITANRVWYRILARASGQTDTAISVVEGTVTRTWPDDGSAATPYRGRVSWRQLR